MGNRILSLAGKNETNKCRGKIESVNDMNIEIRLPVKLCRWGFSMPSYLPMDLVTCGGSSGIQESSIVANSDTEADGWTQR